MTEQHIWRPREFKEQEPASGLLEKGVQFGRNERNGEPTMQVWMGPGNTKVPVKTSTYSFAEMVVLAF